MCVACAEPEQARFQYQWDDRRVLCSAGIDDIAAGEGIRRMGHELVYSLEHQSATLFHGHIPTQTISLDQMFCAFKQVTDNGLQFVTFSDFEQGVAPRAGLAMSFDDDDIDMWYALRGVFRAHRARVTFFVTRFHLWTAEERAMLAELYAAGHDVQAHGVDHLNALDFVAEHTVAEYVKQEVLPSVAALRAAGYPVSAFAFPGGASNDELNAAVLEYLPRLRLTAHYCPY